MPQSHHDAASGATVAGMADATTSDGGGWREGSDVGAAIRRGRGRRGRHRSASPHTSTIGFAACAAVIRITHDRAVATPRHWHRRSARAVARGPDGAHDQAGAATPTTKEQRPTDTTKGGGDGHALHQALCPKLLGGGHRGARAAPPATVPPVEATPIPPRPLPLQARRHHPTRSWVVVATDHPGGWRSQH